MLGRSSAVGSRIRPSERRKSLDGLLTRHRSPFGDSSATIRPDETNMTYSTKLLELVVRKEVLAIYHILTCVIGGPR